MTALLRPCYDLYIPGGCSYLWFRLIEDGADLDLEEYGERYNDPERIGPSLTRYDELRELDFETSINPYWPDVTIDGTRFRVRWMQFALEHGIAPYQPFCVEFGVPHYSKSWTDWGYEYDASVNAEVVALAPCRNPAKTWERFLAHRAKCIETALTYNKRLKDLQWTDRKSMHLGWSRYSVPDVDYYSPLDDYPPVQSGIQYALCTTVYELGSRRLHKAAARQLEYGRSDEGDPNAAINDLTQRVQVAHPELSTEFIKSLPRHYSG